MSLDWRPFSAHDWFAFSGASNWTADQPPLCADLKVGRFDAIAILDPSGLEIHWAVVPDPNSEEELADDTARRLDDVSGAESATLRGDIAILERSMRAVALLKPQMTAIELEALGFVIAAI